ncbi:MAG: glycine C-acetyltransferase [Anaerolineaceae bacterium]|nr:glycine C-acetyltransferase [Anaerolineaceae bacterium]
MTAYLNWINEEIKSLTEAGLNMNIRTISSPQGAWINVDGKKVLNFCSNNYLGLANHPKMVKAAQDALVKYGVGPGAVRIISGNLDIHREFEKRIAAFKGVEDAIALQSGFTANLAAIVSLVGKEDVIFSDELNHASIIDGCRLSRAKVIRFAHANADDLERVVLENQGKYRRGLVITDGVFSMDGDLAPLDKIYEVSSKHGLMLMVDDAHGEGVVGHGGRGIVDHFNLHGKVDIEVGTFSKAFGVVGGCVAGKQEIIDWLRQKSRPFIFSSATPAADIAACIAAIDILEESTDLVDKLWENAAYFRKEMNQMGFNTGQTETPITPVMIGEAPIAKKFSVELYKENIFGSALAFPIVPHGKARIRVMISASHSREDLDFSLQAFEKVGKKLAVI